MLKALISAEDHAALEESIQALYTQHADGKLRLLVEPVAGWALEDVEGLKRTVEDRKQRHAKAQTELDALREKYGDLDPEAAREAMSRPKGNSKEDIDKHVKAATERLEQEYVKKLEAAEAGRTKIRAQLETQMVDAAAAAVLAKKETGGSFALLQAPIRSRVRVEEDDDGGLKTVIMGADGKPMYASRGNSVEPATIEDLVKSLRDIPEYQPAFHGTQASGGGTASAGRAASGQATSRTSDQSPVEALRAHYEGAGA
ncbi:MAG TPA: hypothetical protein VM487_07565 [Phycisphaerae bacterium]|nr:hypothetical protein [Phycisphaerae bacterium]